ncbi:hypothetical protein Cni_G18241 [Canna indica]|uniref:Uncharacterized protein n=1 Tax=Canna indica TaxID=4628 RepID=A0AAQ3KLV3_9LILI|nr:hypothetical protein Cni_G18241 [Canna indica]
MTDVARRAGSSIALAFSGGSSGFFFVGSCFTTIVNVGVLSENDVVVLCDLAESVDLGKHNSPMGKEIEADLGGSPLAQANRHQAQSSILRRPDAFPSLPGSALPSPKSSTIQTSRKWNYLAQPHPAITNLARQHSAVLSHLEQRMSLRRSKSCGEGRTSSAPSDDFIDILSRRPSVESAGTDRVFAVYEPREEDNSFKDLGEVRPPQGDESVRCGYLFLPEEEQAAIEILTSFAP